MAMTLRSAIGGVITCLAIGLAVGTAVGFGVGRLAPEMAAGLLPFLPPEADGLRACTALGLINGAVLGTGVGMVVVAAVAWVESKKAKGAQTPRSD